MNPADFFNIVCEDKMSNKRIAFQSGSFLLFGHNAQLPEAEAPEIEIERVAISALSKPKIMMKLSQLNINVSTVYPLSITRLDSPQKNTRSDRTRGQRDDGGQGPPGDISQAQLNSAISGTSGEHQRRSTLDTGFADPDMEGTLE